MAAAVKNYKVVVEYMCVIHSYVRADLSSEPGSVAMLS